MLLEMHENTVFSLINMEMEVLNRQYHFRKMEMEVSKNTSYLYSCI